MRQPNGRSNGKIALPKIAQSDQTDVLSEEGESLAIGSQAVLLGPLAEMTIRPADATGEINRHAKCCLCHRLGEHRTSAENAYAAAKTVGVVDIRKEISFDVEHRPQ